MTTKKKTDPSGGPLVPIEELAGQMGLAVEHAHSRIRYDGVELAVDWAGRQGVPAEQAARILQRWNAENADISSKTAAYQKYLEERAREAHDERNADYREAARRKENQVAKLLNRVTFSEPTRAKAPVISKEEEAGHPVTFEQFSEGKR